VQALQCGVPAMVGLNGSHIASRAVHVPHPDTAVGQAHQRHDASMRVAKHPHNFFAVIQHDEPAVFIRERVLWECQSFLLTPYIFHY
jgi:hypothetical protein